MRVRVGKRVGGWVMVTRKVMHAVVLPADHEILRFSYDFDHMCLDRNPRNRSELHEAFQTAFHAISSY